jgi:hypothetical protein
MQIPKDKILDMLREQGDTAKADQADQELPDQVETDQHADLVAEARPQTPGAAVQARRWDPWPVRPTSSAIEMNSDQQWRMAWR